MVPFSEARERENDGLDFDRAFRCKRNSQIDWRESYQKKSSLVEWRMQIEVDRSDRCSDIREICRTVRTWSQVVLRQADCLR